MATAGLYCQSFWLEPFPLQQAAQVVFETRPIAALSLNHSQHEQRQRLLLRFCFSRTHGLKLDDCFFQ